MTLRRIEGESGTKCPASKYKTSTNIKDLKKGMHIHCENGQVIMGKKSKIEFTIFGHETYKKKGEGRGSSYIGALKAQNE